MNNYENDLALSLIVGDWPALEKTILENVTDWSTCIQAGGHFGTYPKNLARMFNTVYTFEADKENYAILVENCKDEKNIIHYNVALSAYERTMDVKKIIGGNSGQRLVFPGTEIPAITIDSLNLTSCGLIQLDIERHELYAIMGAIRTIEQFRPVIILEGPEVTNNACDIILDQLGYEFAGRAGVDSVFKYTGKMGKFAEFSESIQLKKKILIAIPTARYIEADTFKSIYDLEVPEGYEVTFQYFYGYRVDQVRNLIADWVVRGFDYLFSVDHDVTFPPDTLKRLLEHNVDLISGVYRQRLEPQRIEIYDLNQNRIEYSDIHNQPIVQIGGCGFGCVLIRKEVFVGVGYPHFEYHPALDHNNTISEDTDFCKKVMNKRFNLWCDPSVLCGHIGSTTMRVELPQIDTIENRLLQISKENHLPSQLVEYTNNLDIEQPNVVYDIGANALEWTRLAKNKWPNSRIIAFEAMNDFNKLYKHFDFENHIGVLSDIDDKQITFYENPIYPWGNSYYIENENESPPGCEFNESHATLKNTKTLDTIVQENNWPYPDLIKIDVQGAEKDILEGAKKCLEKCKHLIVEIQHKEYNKQAPLDNEMFAYLDSIGFQLVTNIHRKDCDGDYHFKKKLIPSVAYIITTYNNEKSTQWSKSAAESCEKVGLKSKLFHGFENKTPQELGDILGIKFGDMNHKAACATASHFALWQRIAESNECAVILEHDAVMIKPIDFDIPDNKIVALGYKYKAEDLKTPQTDPIDIIDIHRHSGAHAYCITPNTAKALLKELNEVGAPLAIDNFYFMRINEESDTESSVPLAITIPEVAVGVIRGSTIWEEPSTLNYTLDHAKIKIDF